MIKLWKKERWLLVPCPDYDVAAMEAWLEQQAQKGLFLSEIGRASCRERV